MDSIRKNLEDRCRDCQFCAGSGHDTIFHERYRGSATELHNGRQVVVRTAIPCDCALGFWIRDECEKEATTIRQPRLQEVIEGRFGRWSIFDPSIPPISQGEIPDWSQWRRYMPPIGERLANPNRRPTSKPAQSIEQECISSQLQREGEYDA